MRLTKHARERWIQRFPELDIAVEYCNARNRVGKKMRKMVKETCPRNLFYCGKTFRGRYMRMTPQGIIFILAPPETVITVLDFRKGKIDGNQ